MINVVFVCYGNICRSPMAEMIFKDITNKNNMNNIINCTSRSTSREEIGNDIYPSAKKILSNHNIKFDNHKATQIKKEEYNLYDYIIIFEERNKRDILNILENDPENKIHLLLEYSNITKNIDDPWYTGEFENCFNEINKGCNDLYKHILNRGDINDK